jgi:hypothetical protein
MRFFKIFKQVACRKNVRNKKGEETKHYGCSHNRSVWDCYDFLGGYEIGNKKVQKPLVA